MKKLLSFANILLLAIYAQAQVVKTDDFELKFPASPKVEEQDVTTEAGEAHINMYQLLYEGAMVLFLDATYPVELNITANQDANKKILKNSKKGSVNNFAGQLGLEVTLISEVFIEYKTLLGLRSIDRVGQYFSQVYTIAHLNKLYSIMVFSETEPQGKIILDDLVNSFSLLKV